VEHSVTSQKTTSGFKGKVKYIILLLLLLVVLLLLL